MPDSPDRQARYDIAALGAWLCGRAWSDDADVEATIAEARERIGVAWARNLGFDAPLEPVEPVNTRDCEPMTADAAVALGEAQEKVRKHFGGEDVT